MAAPKKSEAVSDPLSLILDALKESMRAQRQIIETLSDVRAGIRELRSDEAGEEARHAAESSDSKDDLPILTEVVANEPLLGDLDDLEDDAEDK
ncbi:MAG: hypothetical protein K0U93_29715 [Gammaproteobacteria bacterium]|nr:hypothetical protein [Gammaproteobacteria bacterium]